MARKHAPFHAFLCFALTVLLVLHVNLHLPRILSHTRPATLTTTAVTSLPSFPYESCKRTDLTSHTVSLEQVSLVNTTLIRSYITWHSATRTRIESAYANGKPVYVPLLVVRTDISLTHGVGDRIRALVHAYMCALLSRRLLLIQWTKPVSLSHVFQLGLHTNFTYDEDVFKTRLKEDGRLDARVIQGNYIYRMHDARLQQQTLFLDSVPRPNTTLWFNAPKYMTERHAELRMIRGVPMKEWQIVPMILRALLIPTHALRLHIAHALRDLHVHNGNATESGYVSVHARLGYGLDEVSKDSQRFNLSRHGLHLHSIANCLTRKAISLTHTHKMHPVFYLATDTPNFRPHFIRRVTEAGGRVVRGVEEREVRHIRDVDDARGMMDAFVDVFLLARGKAVVCLRSGFADLAVWMGAVEYVDVVGYDECRK